MSRRIREIRTELFVKFLLYIGCEEDLREHQHKRSGGHRKFNRSGLLRPIIIQAKPDIPVMIIKSNLKTLGISNEDYLNIIEKL